MWWYNAAQKPMPRPNFPKEVLHMAPKKTFSEADMVATTTGKGLLGVLTVLIQIRDGAGTTIEQAYAEARKVMNLVLKP
jgi:hypothetical protein